MEECLERDEKGRIEHNVLYAAYIAFCKQHHFTAEFQNTFTRRFKKMNNKIQKSDGKQFWLSWKLKKQEQKEIEAEQETLI